jgi:hypothetical protein
MAAGEDFEICRLASHRYKNYGLANLGISKSLQAAAVAGGKKTHH